MSYASIKGLVVLNGVSRLSVGRFRTDNDKKAVLSQRVFAYTQ